jgi:hypothetical protein
MPRYPVLAIAALLAAGTALAAPAAQANLLLNGSFEQAPVGNGDTNNRSFASLPGGSGTGSWDTWTSLPGWNAVQPNGAIEIQTKNTVGVTPQDGQYYVELDSHPQSRANSSMTQAFAAGGGTGTLSYYYRPRTNTSGQNGIRVYLNDILVSTADGPPTPPFGVWTLITIANLALENGSNVLRFEAFGTNATYGGFIDNVVLTPIPGAALLFGSALAGLAWARRRNGSAPAALPA